MIDHGLTLYGPPRKWEQANWNSRYWEQIWSYYHVPNGLLRFQSSPEKLKPMISAIESMPEDDIDQLIDQTPPHFLMNNERKFIRCLLKERKKKIHSMIYAWVNFQGVKEYKHE